MPWTVPQALVCALTATDFEDAIRNAISIDGDSDTMAASRERHTAPHPASTANPTTFLCSRLNSTPMRWIGSLRSRYLSA